MGPRLIFFVFAALHCYVAVSLGHLLKRPRLVRLIPPSAGPEDSLEKLFVATRQPSQDNGSSLKGLPRCRQGALDRAKEIDDTCLSCTTNVDTGEVSECPEGCCRTFEITKDLETAHFITCYRGCCSRSIGVLSDSSDREAGSLTYEQVFSVNNDVTLTEITARGQCMIRDGSSRRCGSSCAVFTLEGTPCSNANSFRVPAFGQGFLDSPCSEADDSPGPTSPGDDSTSSSIGDDAGTGSGTDDDGGNRDDLDAEGGLVADGGDDDDRDVDSANDDDSDVDSANDDDSDAAGSANDQDEGGNSDMADSTGPIDGGRVIGDDDENLEASATEEVEQSSPEETDESLGPQNNGEQTTDDGTETNDPACFPAAATVQLVNGRKRMEELRTDDVVLVRPGTYSRVFGFTHEDRDYHGGFLELRTRSGHTLRLTNGHYLYSDGMMRKAKEVRIGHTVKLDNGSTSEVTEIGEWTGYGLFNPQTLDGDIVVDGVVVSTYTEAVDRRMAHALLAPVRAMSEWVNVSSFLNRLATDWRRATELVYGVAIRDTASSCS